jgi:hypothetical protein
MALAWHDGSAVGRTALAHDPTKWNHFVEKIMRKFKRLDALSASRADRIMLYGSLRSDEIGTSRGDMTWRMFWWPNPCPLHRNMR